MSDEVILTPCSLCGRRDVLNNLCSNGCDAVGKDKLEKMINTYRQQAVRGKDNLPMEVLIYLETAVHAYDSGFIRTQDEAELFLTWLSDRLGFGLP